MEKLSTSESMAEYEQALIMLKGDFIIGTLTKGGYYEKLDTPEKIDWFFQYIAPMKKVVERYSDRERYGRSLDIVQAAPDEIAKLDEAVDKINLIIEAKNVNDYKTAINNMVLIFFPDAAINKRVPYYREND